MLYFITRGVEAAILHYATFRVESVIVWGILDGLKAKEKRQRESERERELERRINKEKNEKRNKKKNKSNNFD